MGEAKRKNKNPSFLRDFKPKSKVTMTVVIICIAAIVVIDFVNRSGNSPLSHFEPSRSKGNPNAEMKIVEFADFQCSHCAQGAKVLREYLKNYPDNIYLTLKYYSLGQRHSNTSAIYAECAARQNQFWPFHDLLFDRQAQWRTLFDPVPTFRAMAKEVSINVDKLSACVQRQDVRAVIGEEKQLGDSFNVKSTPTYFVNEEVVVGVEQLKKRLEAHFNTNGS